MNDHAGWTTLGRCVRCGRTALHVRCDRRISALHFQGLHAYDRGCAFAARHAYLLWRLLRPFL